MNKKLICPVCGSELTETKRNYSCPGFYDSGCRVTIWKQTYGHALTTDEAADLLAGKEIGPFRLHNRDGIEFDAFIAYSVATNRTKLRFCKEGDGCETEIR